MKSIISTMAAAGLALSVAACDPSIGANQTAGTLLGAAGGALAGQAIGKGSGRIAATAIGTIAGAYLGSQLGKRLDENDRLAMQQTTQTALERNPTGTSANWRNPDSNHYGDVTPTRTYETAQGVCREYSQTVYIDGQRETAYGTACRDPDGSWRIVNS